MCALTIKWSKIVTIRLLYFQTHTMPYHVDDNAPVSCVYSAPCTVYCTMLLCILLVEINYLHFHFRGRDNFKIYRHLSLFCIIDKTASLSDKAAGWYRALCFVDKQYYLQTEILRTFLADFRFSEPVNITFYRKFVKFSGYHKHLLQSGIIFRILMPKQPNLSSAIN